MKCVIIVAISLLIANVQAGALVPRIISGEDAMPGQFPYIVQLRRQLKQSSGPLMLECGASIIKKNLILTAAHCVIFSEYDYFVAAGVLDTNDHTDAQVIPVKRLYIHPKYSLPHRSYDIAVMVLERDLIFNDYVQPIALPKPFENYDSGEVITVGWGSIHPTDFDVLPAQLQYAKITLLPNSKCKYPLGPYEHEFCAYDPLMEKSSCKGDSGSPLVRENPTRIIGIVSRDTKKPVACEGEPVIYTAVSHFINFISEAEETERARSMINFIADIFFKNY